MSIKKYSYDPEADAAYIHLASIKNIEVSETKELSDDILVDYDKDGRPVGIEILRVKGRVPSKTLKFLQSQGV